jgi:hypothetical protein
MQTGMMLVNRVFPGVFRKGGINGYNVQLIRLKSYHCPLCERRHDNDGGQLVFKGGKYSFFCWRNEDRTLLPLDEEEETMTIDVVEDEECVDEQEEKIQAIIQRIGTMCRFV